MRRVCDPLADDAFAEVYAAGGIQRVNELMAGLVRNDETDPAGLPPAIREFLDGTSTLPQWAEAARIQEGERLFWEFGPPMISALFCASLPFCYLGRKGVQVLALTARLYTNPTRRVLETAQFLVDTLQPGGLTPTGPGVRTAQKVRLMHAAIRLQIRESGQWKPEFDEPINQEDLAGTLMSFSVVVLDAMEKLGFNLPESSKEDYLHCWNVIGQIIGVHNDLLPANVESARALAAAIQRRQAADCPEGRMMTKALLDMLAEHLRVAPLQHVPPALVAYFLGDSWARLLGIDSPHWEGALGDMLHLIDRPMGELTEHSALLAHVTGWFSRHLVQEIILMDRGGNRPSFRLPPELRGKWGIG